MRPPRTPRGPRCRSSAAPLYLALRAREGGRPGVGWSAGGPRVWLTVRSVFYSSRRSCRACGMPPALRAAPQNGGRSRGFLNVGVLRQGASRFAVSFMRAPNANLDAKILAKKPTKPGGQREARGACSRTLQNRHKEQNTNRTPDARSAPLPNEVRHRGAADERQRGPRGVRGGRILQNRHDEQNANLTIKRSIDTSDRSHRRSFRPRRDRPTSGGAHRSRRHARTSE